MKWGNIHFFARLHYSNEFFLKFVQWPNLVLCSATVDLCGW
jgi:hypothetical protein